ncbi:GTP cyclohydrolase II [Candidatus Micrarchaeota archaeon]|nr:GTP cyclohydrolase II [Candidatus Micrarchaeota archaeon]
MIELYSKAKLPTNEGEFDIYVFREGPLEHAVLVKPGGREPLLVRIHSKCLTGEVFGSLKCDCREQLEIARSMISEEGGMLLYLDQEGRGIGLGNKIKAYGLEAEGYDTVDATMALGFSADERNFGVAADILEQFEISSVRLLTNHPKKISTLEERGIAVERIPIKGSVNSHNLPYLLAKQVRFGHDLGIMREDYADKLRELNARRGKDGALPRQKIVERR